MRKYIITCVAIVVIVLFGTFYYVKQIYLFDPFSKMHEDITFYEWNHFKKPLEMEVAHIDLGWKTKIIKDDTDMKMIINELIESEYINREELRDGRHFAITLKKPGAIDIDGMILQFDGYDNGYIRVNNGKTKKMTGELKKRIEGILNDLESMN